MPTTKLDTKATHTPGPWGMETVRTSCGVCHKVGPWPHKWRAGATMSACIYDDYPSPPEGTDTMLANARLIAAAPELLAALIAAKQEMWLIARPQWTMADFKNWAVIQQIDAALEKADGKLRSAEAIALAEASAP